MKLLNFKRNQCLYILVLFHVKEEKIIIGGFGQGGAIALMAGMQYPNKLSGILVVNGFPIGGDFAIEENAKQTPVQFLHGKDNLVVPCEYAENCFNRLKDRGMKEVEIYQEEEAGHEITKLQKNTMSLFFGTLPFY